jgi:hypothetical protein
VPHSFSAAPVLQQRAANWGPASKVSLPSTVSLELAPWGHPQQRPASAGRPGSTRGLSQPLSGFRRLELRGLVSCRRPFVGFTPFRGFPSQESWSPCPLLHDFGPEASATTSGSTPPAPLRFSAAPSLRDRLGPSPPVSATPVRGANPSPACRSPPSAMAPFPNRLHRVAPASSTLSGRREPQRP